MADIRFEWNNKAFYDLRRDPAIIEELEHRGRQIVDAANATLPEKVGYKMASFQGRKAPQGRWFVNVWTSSNHAKYSEARHNTLVRVLGSTQGVSVTGKDYQP